jgi:hypothetical protein
MVPDMNNGENCDGCGGVYRFDTSIPSALWNKVIRASGAERGGEYLCAACIVRAFVKAGESFTAELSSEEFHGDRIEVTINGVSTGAVALLNDENNALRVRIRELELAQSVPAVGQDVEKGQG